MAAVNERLESSSEEEIDSCYFSSNESFEGEEGASEYTCEPEYSKDELIKLGIDVLEEKSDVSTDDSNDSNELDSSSCENLHWCTCTRSCIMPTLIEAIDLFCYKKTDDY